MNPVALLVGLLSFAASCDARDIANGSLIYEHGYCDQPYVVLAPDGTWVCTFTTNPGHEGSLRQYVACTTSRDQGLTWSDPIPIEAPGGPEASWVMPLMTGYGRVYAFYDFNGDEVRQLPNGKPCRADMLGWYCYRYSDDLGKTWSDRHRLPVRVTACDRANDWGGSVQILWGIGKPITWEGNTWFGFTKLGRYMLEDGEGWFFHSPNILEEREPDKIVWEMYPEGEHGLRGSSFSSTQEEHNLVPLSNGDLYCVYRTTLGHMLESYSRDGGRSWSPPEPVRYADGRIIKNPRACPRLWRTSSGRYLLWHHNHGGKDFHDRNPAWVSGGTEVDGTLRWSQPEILLYAEDTSYETGRISYPDLVEQDGRYWVTATQKTRATVNEVEPALFETLWRASELTPPGDAVVRWHRTPDLEGQSIDLGILNEAGLSIHVTIAEKMRRPDSPTWTWQGRDGAITLEVKEDGALSFLANSGSEKFDWQTEPGSVGTTSSHEVTVILDEGPGIVRFVVDGKLLDGGEHQQYGWSRYPRAAIPRGDGQLTLGERAVSLSIYPRALRTVEAAALTMR